MSRAFVGENDGWGRCLRQGEECMFAAADGRCALGYCKQRGETPEMAQREEAPPPPVAPRGPRRPPRAAERAPQPPRREEGRPPKKGW